MDKIENINDFNKKRNFISFNTYLVKSITRKLNIKVNVKFLNNYNDVSVKIIDYYENQDNFRAICYKKYFNDQCYLFTKNLVLK